MKAVIQRVKHSSCEVDGKITGKIDKGILIFLGITHEDTQKDIDFLVEKILNLRIFQSEDDKKHFDRSLKEIGGSALVISQFTLYANTKKGRRPSFDDAAKPAEAEKLYRDFITSLKGEGVCTEEGVFGAMMDINLLNSGPVTIIIDSKDH